MDANDVLDVLFDLILKRGKLKFIRSDNGPEFIAKHLQTWLRKVGIEPIQIYPGSPWENGYNERFNGTLRNKILNAAWFCTVHQAQTAINVWLRRYNHIKPLIRPALRHALDPQQRWQLWLLRVELMTNLLLSIFLHNCLKGLLRPGQSPKTQGNER